MSLTEQEYLDLQRKMAAKTRKPRTQARIGHEQRFFIPVCLPGLNEMLDARGRVFGAQKGKRRKNQYAELKKQYEIIISNCIQLAKLKPMEKTWIVFKWYEKNKRRDPDNIAAGKKYILDSLVNCSILKSDGWRHVAGWNDLFVVSKNRPGVEVALWPHDS